MGFSLEDYKKLQAAVDRGKTKGQPIPEKTTSTKTWSKETRSKGTKQKAEMEWVIKAMFPEYVKEFKFSDRKFRFDFYIPWLKTGIEYEGIMVKSEEKSGHTSMAGYSSNCEKYNLAQILGYRVLRYTALNHKTLGTDLQTLLDNHK
jgi:hypothetical protein